MRENRVQRGDTDKCVAEVDGTVIEAVLGDITELSVDAIVNPANSLMIMGGGVAAAIKRKGGEEIEREARQYAPVEVGKAIVTRAGKLPAKYVIHAPTMERPAMRIESSNVAKAVLAALRKAGELSLTSIAFPGMGTGAGGVPYSEAARVMVKTIVEFVKEHKTALKRILLVAIDNELYREFCKAIEKIYEY
ncbi:MAG TPA: macro domain-containing protein [Ignisphaera sp.]|uniref:Macro domain-containing protein n=1 Tax=Ignisphaera aggregans TaxID=334771 RepID=A0A832YX56_9CREN|nr:macro domain-containing protein [Ignisphaera sp.]HIP56778.1 macro domain-containing protein [Ignisphaera aggregans]